MSATESVAMPHRRRCKENCVTQALLLRAVPHTSPHDLWNLRQADANCVQSEEQRALHAKRVTLLNQIYLEKADTYVIVACIAAETVTIDLRVKPAKNRE
jgi:hypothetical protein